MADDLFSGSDDDAMTPAWRRLDAEAHARVQGLGPVLLVADHLDAALAFAEDLTHTAFKLPENGASDTATLTARNDAFMTFAQSVRALELALTSRVLQARKRSVAIELSSEDFQRLIRSFVGGTAIFADAVEQDRARNAAFSSNPLIGGPEAMRFLKLRGVIDRDVRSLDEISLLAITETYPVAGLIELGPLMDMVAAFLDALDTAFDLYGPALARGAPLAGSDEPE